jgi:hypothetical protein
LDILRTKPRAIENAAPLIHGEMPEELDTFRSKCKEKNKNEQLVQIMILGEKFEEDLILKAVHEANKLPNPTYTYVLNCLNWLQKGEADGSDEDPVEQFKKVGQFSVEEDPLDNYKVIFSQDYEEDEDHE